MEVDSKKVRSTLKNKTKDLKKGAGEFKEFIENPKHIIVPPLLYL